MSLRPVFGRLPPAGDSSWPRRLSRGSFVAPRHGNELALPAPGEGRGVRARAPGHAGGRARAQSRLLPSRVSPDATVVAVPAMSEAVDRVCPAAERLVRHDAESPRCIRSGGRRLPGRARPSGRALQCGQISARRPALRGRACRRPWTSRDQRQRADLALGKGCAPEIRLAYRWSATVTPFPNRPRCEPPAGRLAPEPPSGSPPCRPACRAGPVDFRSSRCSTRESGRSRNGTDRVEVSRGS